MRLPLWNNSLLMRHQWFPNTTHSQAKKKLQDCSKTYHNTNCRPYWFWVSLCIRVGNILMMGKAFGMLYEMKDPHKCEIPSIQQKIKNISLPHESQLTMFFWQIEWASAGANTTRLKLTPTSASFKAAKMQTNLQSILALSPRPSVSCLMNIAQFV